MLHWDQASAVFTAWWWLALRQWPQHSHPSHITTITGQRVLASLPALPAIQRCSNTDTISQHSHSSINKTSCWHVSVPVGITRSVSSFTSPRWMSLKFTQKLHLLWCRELVTLLPSVLLFVLHLFISFFYDNFLSFHPRCRADPPHTHTPSSFNSTITQHNTISAKASAGRIRVTWAAPDCNQSKSNECRTKAGIITLAGITFLSFFFSVSSLFLPFFHP